jgi:hypothetical protein
MSKYKPVFFDIETTGFNPMTPRWYSDSIAAEVTAVAVGEMRDWTDGGDETRCNVFANRGDQEYETIQEVREHLEFIEAKYASNGWTPFLVGHNVIQFDVMYWAARCSRLRQNPYPVSHGWRRLDTMRALSLPPSAESGSTNYPGQQDYADYLGFDYVDRLDGSDMPQAFVDGDYEEIITHVRDDVETLMDIFYHEREDMVNEFWSHYDSGHDDELTEPAPEFTDNVTIDTDG